MAVRRSRPGARRQKAYSQIVNCRSEEQYAKVHKQAGEKGLVLVEFVAGWSTSSKTMQPYVEYLSKSAEFKNCLLYTSPSPRDKRQSRMPSSA